MLDNPAIQGVKFVGFGLVLLLVLSPVPGQAASSEPKGTETMPVGTRTFHDPQTAANLGLKDLQKIGLSPDQAHEAYATALGFSSAAETLKAQLGIGLRTYDVVPSSLQRFHKEDDPVTLLLDLHEIVFPVLVQGEPRSSLTIAELERGKGWRVLKKGRTALIRLIEEYRTSADDNLVVISSLGLQFLGKRSPTDQEELVLVPLFDSTALEIQAGQPVFARELFVQINKQIQIPDQDDGAQKIRPSIAR